MIKIGGLYKLSRRYDHVNFIENDDVHLSSNLIIFKNYPLISKVTDIFV